MRAKWAFGMILCILGALCLTLSAALWAFLIDDLERLPEDFEITLECRTGMTWYFDPSTIQPMPEGSSLELGVLIRRRIFSDDGQYNADTGVIREEVFMEVEGQPAREWESSYVLDRRNFLNQADPRAFSATPDNQADRSGYYYPLYPRGTSPDRSYLMWREEVAGPVAAVCAGEDNYGGVDTLIFSFAISPQEKREANPAIVKSLGLPQEVGFTQLAEQLTWAGVDVAGMLERLTALASPQDLEALESAKGKALPVKYYLSGETEIAVQPELGVTVDIRRDTERLSLEADPAPLVDLFFIMSKYSYDPVIGRELQRLTQLQASLGLPQEVFEFTFSTSQDTVDEALSLVRDALGKARIVEAAPWVLLLLGALLLVPGLVLCRKKPGTR
jgi:hypothetical protein